MFKEPSKQYLLMLEIKYIVKSWQDLSYSDRDAIGKIERMILDYRKWQWEYDHK